MSGPQTPTTQVFNVSFCSTPIQINESSTPTPVFQYSGPFDQDANLGKSCLIKYMESANYGAAGLTPTMGTPPSTTKLLYCLHGNVMETCMAGDEEAPCGKGYSPYPGQHCHSNEIPGKDVQARRKLILASILCVLFMIGEAVGGYLSNSLAIATDASHLLTDFASFMISLSALFISARPATQLMSFGWHRAEVIGALTSVIMIWVVTGILVYMAVERVINTDFEVEPVPMLITAGIGVIINLIMGLTLHQHGHTHGGGSSEENINVRAAFIHVVGDFIQSFGVLVAAIVIFFRPEWKIVDPICTFIFSVLVMLTTYSIVRDTLMVLMEGKPKGIDFEQVIQTFMGIDGVVRVHNLRIWALSLDKIALSAHLAIRSNIDCQRVLSEASKHIRSKYNFFEMTLQIEQFIEVMDDCMQCKMPEK